MQPRWGALDSGGGAMGDAGWWYPDLGTTRKAGVRISLSLTTGHDANSACGARRASSNTSRRIDDRISSMSPELFTSAMFALVLLSSAASRPLLSTMGLLTADHLHLGIPTFDPQAYYNAVKHAPATSAQGARLDKILKTLGK